MNEHPIDDLFRKGLGNYQAPAPQSVWQKVAAKQAQQRQAKLLRWATVLLLAGGLLLGLGLYSLPEASSDLPTATKPSQTQEQPLASSPAAPLAADEAAVKPPAQSALHSSATTAGEPSTFLAPAAENKRTDQATPPIKISQTLSEQALSSSNATAATNRETPDINQLSEPIPASQKVSSDRVEIALASHLSTQAQYGETAIQNIYTLPLPRLAPYNRPVPQPALHLNNSFKKSVRAHWEVDFLTGLAYARQSLKSLSEEDRNDLGAREISEFPAASMLSSLLVAYRKPSGWGFRSGLSYTLLRNRFEYEQHRLVGPDSLQTTFIKSSNRIRMLEIPLLLSYELPGKRFHLALNAGPILNVSTAAKGRYLIASQQEPLLLEDEKIYRSNVGISWQAGFTAAYDLGRGNSLLIEPSFRSYPQSLTRPSYNLQETYWLAGLQIGLRHRL